MNLHFIIRTYLYFSTLFWFSGCSVFDTGNNPSYKIAFQQGSKTLYMVNLDGSSFSEVADLPASTYSLHWSPDGSKLIYDEYGTILGILELKSGKTTQLGYGGSVSWFPDSEHIAISHDSIYSVNVLNGEIIGIAPGRVPKVNHTGNKIAFITIEDNYHTNYLNVMNIDGTEIRQLADSVRFDAFKWSPDGNKIAFLKDDFSLWIVNLSTKKSKNLNSEKIGGFSWSPDGKRLAYLKDDRKLYVTSLDGHEKKFLTDGAVNPIWSPYPNENFIIYYSPEQEKIMKINSENGQSDVIINKRVSVSYAISPVPIP